METKKEIILRCSCGCKCVVVYEEFENNQRELAVEFFENGIHNSTSMWNRFKYIIRYLFTGKGFTNGIIFDENSIKQLKEFLND